jgi:hypothetical protein
MREKERVCSLHRRRKKIEMKIVMGEIVVSEEKFS